MAVSFEDLLAEMSPERRARIEKRTQELIEEERRYQQTVADMAAPQRFEIYRGKGGRFRFRLVSPSGELIMRSAVAYASEDLAKDAIDIVTRAIKDGAVKTAA